MNHRVRLADSVSNWVYAVVLALVIAAGAGAWVLYSRRREAIDELAEIFSYTAELLAAGDAIEKRFSTATKNSVVS